MADQPAPVIIQQQPAARGMVTTIAGDLFGAFQTSPILLLIVLLNIAFAGSAAYYLLQMEKYRADDRRALAALLDKCLMQTVPLTYLQQERGTKTSP
jgi:hypothetical protein